MAAVAEVLILSKGAREGSHNRNIYQRVLGTKW